MVIVFTLMTRHSAAAAGLQANKYGHLQASCWRCPGNLP